MTTFKGAEMGANGTVGDSIVIGIDGGGTHTRAIAVDMQGHVIGSAVEGGAHPGKVKGAQQYVRSAIAQVIAAAGAAPEQVRAIVSGFAGLDRDDDHVWAEQHTAVAGLACPRVQVNDAVVAHAGAFIGGAGVVVIAGTGSILFAVDERGRHMRNYDFQHYAAAAARHLAYDAVHRLIADGDAVSDEQLSGDIYRGLQVPDRRSLAELARTGFMPDRMERDRLFGQLAPSVTAAALRGVPLAVAVCDQAAQAIAVGVRVLGACFELEEIAVACIGSVARHPAMLRAIERELSADVSGAGGGRRYRVHEPAYSAAAGAALLAMRRAGAEVSPLWLDNLRLHSAARVDEAAASSE